MQADLKVRLYELQTAKSPRTVEAHLQVRPSEYILHFPILGI